jgi:DNA-binding LacI/PurR family transcriptional regulator
MKENQQHNTILDLAAALKLSPATISRALNNTSYVKAETKQRVLEMAVKLGYRRNSMAAGLRNSKTRTVGLILPKISMYFHAAVVTIVQNLLYAKGYNLIIGQSNDDPLMEKELVETFFSSRVDALITSCTLFTEDFSHFDIFSAHQIPVIFYDRVPPKTYQAGVIKGDDFNGGYLAGKRLIEAGCKNLAIICGPLTSNLYQDRSAGFLHALHEHQITLNEAQLFYQSLTPELTQQAMDKLFADSNQPDGLFITSDSNAVVAIQYALKLGFSIPDDLRVIGYSNDPVTSVITPSITTIAQSPTLFGTQLVELLFQLLENPGAVQRYQTPITIPVELIVRNSG